MRLDEFLYYNTIKVVYSDSHGIDKIDRYIKTIVISEYVLLGRIGNRINLFCCYKRRRYKRLLLYTTAVFQLKANEICQSTQYGRDRSCFIEIYFIFYLHVRRQKAH